MHGLYTPKKDHRHRSPRGWHHPPARFSTSTDSCMHTCQALPAGPLQAWPQWGSCSWNVEVKSGERAHMVKTLMNSGLALGVWQVVGFEGRLWHVSGGRGRKG
eukprot:1159947-Pelagomonas_calceolata.AAC.2